MRFFITLLVANALAIAAAAAESPVINIAVVRDGPSWYSDELTAMIDADLQEHIHLENDVLVPRSIQMEAELRGK